MHENCKKKFTIKKGLFLMPVFLQVLYDAVQKKYPEEHTIASKTAERGQNEKTLLEIRTDVLKRMKEYPYFCKSCKPPKKKW